MKARPRPHRVRHAWTPPSTRRDVTVHRATPLWRAVVLAILFAFSWQSFVTQTHVHDEHRAGGVARAVPGTAQAAPGDDHSPAPATCPICRDAAHAGRFILPPPIVWRLPAIVCVWLAVRLAPAAVRTRRSHAWRSRGPPLPLLT